MMLACPPDPELQCFSSNLTKCYYKKCPHLLVPTCLNESGLGCSTNTKHSHLYYIWWKSEEAVLKKEATLSCFKLAENNETEAEMEIWGQHGPGLRPWMPGGWSREGWRIEITGVRCVIIRLPWGRPCLRLRSLQPARGVSLRVKSDRPPLAMDRKYPQLNTHLHIWVTLQLLHHSTSTSMAYDLTTDPMYKI